MGNGKTANQFSPFSWQAENDKHKIKRLLFLNPGVFWKLTVWGLFSKSQNYSKYYEIKVTEVQTE